MRKNFFKNKNFEIMAKKEKFNIYIYFACRKEILPSNITV